MRVIDDKGRLFGKINLLDLLGIIILSGLLVFGCWKAAYRYQSQKEIAPLRQEIVRLQDKYEASQSEVKVCRGVLREEVKPMDTACQERLGRIFKAYPRLRRKFR